MKDSIIYQWFFLPYTNFYYHQEIFICRKIQMFISTHNVKRTTYNVFGFIKGAVEPGYSNTIKFIH